MLHTLSVILTDLLGNYTSLVVATIVYILVSAVILFVMRFIHKKVIKSANSFDDYIFNALQTPLKILLIIIGSYIIVTQVNIILPQSNLSNLVIYFDSVIIGWLIIAVIMIISHLQKYFLNEKNAHIDTILLVSKIIKIAIVAILSLTLFQSLGFNISSILAFGGIGSLVVGMAAKDMLSNIFGGIMVNLDNPFTVGDWIRVNNVEGTVEHIGWRTTRIRTFSKNPVYLPNSFFSTAAIETPSRMTNRRIREIIGLRYDDMSKINAIMVEIETMLKSHMQIDSSALTMVYFQTFNSSSLDIVVYTFTKTTNWHEYHCVKSEILISIYDIIKRYGADIAYPTQTLKLEQSA